MSCPSASPWTSRSRWAGRRPLSRNSKRLEEIGTVFIKFTETRGGTDLGISVDQPACDASKADFAQGSGTLHVEGTLILNDDPVRCIADIDLAA